MPLYARTEKRLKRKEREDELGITAIKQAMKEAGELEDGSEGSVSGESSDDESEVEDEDEDDDEDEDEDEEEGSDDDSEAESEDNSDHEMESGSEADSEVFPLTIEDVESNPIYPLDEYEGCLLCPGKLLKHAQMRETHLSSASHNRAMKRWKARLAEAEAGERLFPETNDPRDVMNEILDDLEDRRTGTKPEVEGEDEKVEPAPAAAASTETDSKTTTEGGKTNKEKKDKRSSRRKDRKAKSAGERKDLKAQDAIKSISTSAGVTTNGSTTPTKPVEGGKKGEGLNRRARRLLAKQSGAVGSEKPAPKAQGDQAGKKDKAGKKVKAGKGSMTPAPVSATTPVDGEGEKKKRRKRISETKA